MSHQRGSLNTLKQKYGSGVPLVFVTSYDYTSGLLAEKAEVDGILVGDSLGMVMKGDPDTTQVTIEGIV